MDAFERAYHREKAARKQAEDDRDALKRDLSKKQLSQLNADLLRNQAQLVQSEKLATVGQFGVAHEINRFSLSNLFAELTSW